MIVDSIVVATLNIAVLLFASVHLALRHDYDYPVSFTLSTKYIRYPPFSHLLILHLIPHQSTRIFTFDEHHKYAIN